MTWMRGLWAGATLLLALSGCSEDGDDKVKGGGVYSPIITGIASNKEPAVRGVANELTVLVTNVNNYPITYHWSAGAGSLTDSIGATATWVAPNAIGIYPVTVSIEARDDAADVNFFKSTTFQVYVDNEYIRWTKSTEIQFDPAPTPSGGVLFSQFRNIATGETDAYNVPDLGLSPERLTQNFFLARSPTMRFDGQQVAIAARKKSTDSLGIWVLPAAGGDTSAAIPGALVDASVGRSRIANPRYARAANWCLYNSDEGSAPNPKPWFGPFTAAPERLIVQGALATTTLWLPNWGPDGDGDDLPDSVVCQGFRFFGQSNQISTGLFKFPTRPPQDAGAAWLTDLAATEPDWSPDGQHIIYTKPNPGTGERDIWIIHAASSDPSTAVRVTTGPADDSQPRFSHDGSSIYFVSNRADRYGLNGIYTTERRGTNIWSVSGFDRP